MFPDLAAFHAAERHARDERDLHAERITQRWTQLKDPDVRALLFKDAAVDVIRSTKPGRKIHDLLQGGIPSSLVTTLGMSFASTQRSMGRRLLFSGLALLAGRLLGRSRNGSSGVLSQLADGAGRVVRLMRAKQAARRSHAPLHEEAVNG